MVRVDQEDSDFIFNWTLRAVAFGLAVIGSAAMLGLAVRVFSWAAG